MISEIKEATRLASKALDESTHTTQVKSLIKQLTAEIDNLIYDGYWDFAVRLSHYRHEFAKTHSNLDWYLPYLEIRKVRDTIKIMTDND